MAVRILVGIISVSDQAANVTNELESAGLARSDLRNRYASRNVVPGYDSGFTYRCIS